MAKLGLPVLFQFSWIFFIIFLNLPPTKEADEDKNRSIVGWSNKLKSKVILNDHKPLSFCFYPPVRKKQSAPIAQRTFETVLAKLWLDL